MNTGGFHLAIAAGGTGGHILPGIETGRALLASVQDSRVTWLSGGRDIEEHIYTSRGIQPLRLRSGAYRGAGKALVSKAEMVADTGAALRHFRRDCPDAVLAFGGGASAPVLVAANLLRIPIFLHESNAVAGRTTRKFSRHARRVFLGMADCQGQTGLLTGTPTQLPETPLLPPAERDLVLCMGGSQGASGLNELFLGALADPRLTGMPVQFHLVTGPGKDTLPLPGNATRAKLTISEYEPDMRRLLSRARLAVSRAGAGTLADLAVHGVPALLVPYPHAMDDHQAANAMYYAGRGAAEMVRQEELRPEDLAGRLAGLLGSENRLSAMSAAMSGLSHQDAAHRVIGTILSELGVACAAGGSPMTERTTGATG